MKKLLLVLSLGCMMIACSSNPSAHKDNETKALKVVEKEFKMVEVPIIYTTPESRAGFVALHYWDNFDFKDTAYVHLPEITEQAWVDYLQVLSLVPQEVSSESIRHLIQQAEQDSIVFAYFRSLSDKYLYDPNSPLRDEELYISALEALLNSSMNHAEKSTLSYRLSMAKKNRVGDRAADFIYTLENGIQSHLHVVAADYTLLFFNNPGCKACAEVIHALKSSPVLNSLIENGRLVVLSLYPDEDLKEWREHLSDMSAKWINGYDKNLVIKNKELYDLRAIPTLYLLDKKKTVLLKDAPFDKIEQYFNW